MADRGRGGQAVRRTTGARPDIRLRGAFGDIEIQLRPAPVSAAERNASVRELRKLVYDFKYLDPGARRAAAAISSPTRTGTRRPLQQPRARTERGNAGWLLDHHDMNVEVANDEPFVLLRRRSRPAK